jgi:ABC-type nitrate/sulfonate/bicarbonate transport system ATPase subunit
MPHPRKINAPGPGRGMIFQEHRLMPWLTVEKNVTLGPGGKTFSPPVLE